MLSRLSARIPLFLRVVMTGMSALAVIAVGSAFTLIPASQPLHQASLEVHAESSTWAHVNEQMSREAAHVALIDREAHEEYVEHVDHVEHVRHVAHVRHLAAVAAQAAAAKARARYAAAVTVIRATPAPVSQAVASPVTYRGSGSMQQCIISRESGGNSQVVNASGHYGLYQFSYATWVASGGNGADFGHAPVTEQNQVFANAVAARGYRDWAPYDGCGS